MREGESETAGKQSQHDAGTLGDWSGLRGAEYHLIYAIWLIVTGRVGQLSFYDGNDLRAIAPPADVMTDPSGVQVRAHAGDGKDLWYQPKATDKPWTMGGLLEKNLLLNFLLNALESREAGHEFDVHLVTQAEFHPSTVDAFLRDPSTAPAHQARLDHIIERTRQEWSRHRPSSTAPESKEFRWA